MGAALSRWGRWAAVGAFVLVAVACGSDDDEEASAEGRFACLDFAATVTQGPNAGKSWTGDLVLDADETGAFTGLLVPVGAADREKLEVIDASRATCRAVGQRNAAQVSWFLYCDGGERIFGTGQVTPAGENQELRGIINGPTDADFGVYHGRNYPPYIRIISPEAA